jgi:CBS domain-containing protein
MFVRDVMTKKPFTIRNDKRLQAVSALFEWGKFRHVPVVDEHDVLVGVVSLTDVLKASSSELDPAKPAEQRRLELAWVPVSRAMTADVVTVAPDERIAVAASRMLEFKIDCLPVVERGRVVGIVTAFDLLGVVAGQPVGPAHTAR